MMSQSGRSGMRSKAQHGKTALMQHIRKRINDGVWSSGYRLPPERELVEQFGIARNTLRKVMDQLEEEGLISRHVGRGTFVNEKLELVPEAGETLLQRIHGASPAEVMELRLIVEPQFVALAATRATGRDLQQMYHCLEESERASNILEFEYWDGMLHHAILAAARNNLLADVYEAINGVRKQPEWESLKQRSVTPERLERYRSQHRDIVQALRARDGEAASAAVRQHLLEVRNGMMGE